jgi:hypothetical protein
VEPKHDYLFPFIDETGQVPRIAFIAQGIIYTAAHCLNGETERVFSREGEIPLEGVEIRKSVHNHDIAAGIVLEDNDFGLPVYEGELKGNEKITIATVSPGDNQRLVLEGTVDPTVYDNKGRIILNIDHGDTPLHEDRIENGMSGSPILIDGKVVGLVTEHWPDIDITINIYHWQTRGEAIKIGD